jgi:prepilin-type N-terminal cleavage/methylation domain-containing protein
MNISSQRSIKTRSALRAGFTLIEIMIVVMIIGLLAAIAIPNISANIAKARKQAIINNLRTIDLIKTQWAAETKKGEGDLPSREELAPFFNGGKFPTTVMNEVYNVNPVGTPPTATVSSKLLDIPAGGEVVIPDK